MESDFLNAKTSSDALNKELSDSKIVQHDIRAQIDQLKNSLVSVSYLVFFINIILF